MGNEKVVIIEVSWNKDAFTILSFAVLKKGLFGGMKEDRKYKGWNLCFQNNTDGSVKFDHLSFHNGDIRAVPFDPQLAVAVLQSAGMALKEKGDSNNSAKAHEAARAVWSKHING